MTTPVIAVLCGGTSSEREVSLGSGKASALALSRSFPTRLFEVNANALPDGLRADTHVVFSTLHGTFGEDGGMQTLLDRAGIAYAGCDAQSSARTIDKAATKAAAATRGVKGAESITFSASTKPDPQTLLAKLGESVVFKPNDQGSSVGLAIVSGTKAFEEVLAGITSGNWIAERRIIGRELSVGILNGKAMGVVEIRPKSGVYDYSSKYTVGMTEYLAPAPLDEPTTAAVKAQAEAAFAACGCRDYARVDFMLSAQNQAFLLEINTLPGMKETSLLPMSARCVGLDFIALVRELVTPALKRFHPMATA